MIKKLALAFLCLSVTTACSASSSNATSLMPNIEIKNRLDQCLDIKTKEVFISNSTVVLNTSITKLPSSDGCTCKSAMVSAYSSLEPFDKKSMQFKQDFSMLKLGEFNFKIAPNDSTTENQKLFLNFTCGFD